MRLKKKKEKRIKKALEELSVALLVTTNSVKYTVESSPVRNPTVISHFHLLVVLTTALLLFLCGRSYIQLF